MTYLKCPHRLFSVIGMAMMAFGLTGCDHSPKPVINPHPKYFVTVSGNIQPHMPYPMTIMLKATYAAYHPNCGVWVSKAEGVRGLAGHSEYYPAHPDAKGNYTIKVPIDRYQPGKCDWKIAWVMYGLVPRIPLFRNYNHDDPWADMIRFGNKNNPNELPVFPAKHSGTTYCGKSGLDSCIGFIIQGGYANNVSRNKSYQFIQNIKNKRGK